MEHKKSLYFLKTVLILGCFLFFQCSGIPTTNPLQFNQDFVYQIHSSHGVLEAQEYLGISEILLNQEDFIVPSQAWAIKLLSDNTYRIQSAQNTLSLSIDQSPKAEIPLVLTEWENSSSQKWILITNGCKFAPPLALPASLV